MQMQMQNPFSKLSPQQVAFLSGLAAAVLAALLELIKDGQPFTINSVVYALVSALGAYLAKVALPGTPAAPSQAAQEPASPEALDAEAK